MSTKTIIPPIAKKNIEVPRLRLIYIISTLAVLSALYFLSRYNVVLFHSASEIFSIVIAWTIYLISFNARKYIDNGYLLFIGMAFLFVGAIDLLHTLAYKGIYAFGSHYGDNLPTQLWIIARYLESLALLTGIFFLKRKVPIFQVMVGLGLLSAAAVISAFSGVFPDAFITGRGLTGFKIVSEYVISGIFFITLLLLYRERQSFSPHIFRLLVFSIALTIAEEIVFTLYIDVQGITNIIGHFFKIASFYMIYRAIVAEGISKPQEVVFHQLTESKERYKKLAKEREFLIREVHHRVKNNLHMISSIIDLQSMASNQETRDKLNDLRSRVSAISVIHENLYSSGNLANIDIDDYISQLANRTINSFTGSGEDIDLELNIEKADLETDIIINLGMVISELLTNSLKYAFANKKGNKKIQIELKKVEDYYVLRVLDNGRGFPDGFDPQESSSFGMNLLKSVAKQLSGDLEFKSLPGCSVSLTFPVDQEQ